MKEQEYVNAVLNQIQDIQRMLSIVSEEIRSYCEKVCKNSIGYEPCITSNCSLVVALYWTENARNMLDDLYTKIKRQKEAAEVAVK